MFEKRSLMIFLAITLFGCGMQLPNGSAASHESFPTVSELKDASRSRETAYRWRRALGEDDYYNRDAYPLYEAIINGNHNMAFEILKNDKKKANILLHDGEFSPLMIAALMNDLQIVKALLEAGADVNYIMTQEPTAYPTALVVALSTPRQFNIANPDYKIFWLLIDNGADINMEYPVDYDIALGAVALGSHELVPGLLKRGYRRDLRRLRKWLDLRLVGPSAYKARDEAIRIIDDLLQAEK